MVRKCSLHAGISGPVSDTQPKDGGLPKEVSTEKLRLRLSPLRATHLLGLLHGLIAFISSQALEQPSDPAAFLVGVSRTLAAGRGCREVVFRIRRRVQERAAVETRYRECFHRADPTSRKELDQEPRTARRYNAEL